MTAIACKHVVKINTHQSRTCSITVWTGIGRRVNSLVVLRLRPSGHSLPDPLPHALPHSPARPPLRRPFIPDQAEWNRAQDQTCVSDRSGPARTSTLVPRRSSLDAHSLSQFARTSPLGSVQGLCRATTTSARWPRRARIWSVRHSHDTDVVCRIPATPNVPSRSRHSPTGTR